MKSTNWTKHNSRKYQYDGVELSYLIEGNLSENTTLLQLNLIISKSDIGEQLFVDKKGDIRARVNDTDNPDITPKVEENNDPPFTLGSENNENQEEFNNEDDTERRTARLRQGFFSEEIDFLDDKILENVSFDLSDKENINVVHCLRELREIVDLLKQEQLSIRNSNTTRKNLYSTKTIKTAEKLLHSENLFLELNRLIGESGVIGEEQSRLLLYLIASSYKFKYNLHGIIQSEDVKAGHELAKNISNLIPELDSRSIYLTSTKAFRYAKDQEYNKRFLLISDYENIINSNAIDDLKKLQSDGQLINDTTKKNQKEELETVRNQLNGHHSSLGACKDGKRYFANEPKTIIVGTDTSEKQLEQLMIYDCNKMSGSIDYEKEKKVKEQLRCVIDQLQPLEVVIPLAYQLILPPNIQNARLLSQQLMSFCSIITLFNQKRRKRDLLGKVIAIQEDLELAIELFMDAIIINIDGLNPSTRDHFESIKELYLSKPDKKDTKLKALEIREELGFSQSTLDRVLQSLLLQGYVHRVGYPNTGYQYKVVHWNELEKMKNILLSRLANNN